MEAVKGFFAVLLTGAVVLAMAYLVGMGTYFVWEAFQAGWEAIPNLTK